MMGNKGPITYNKSDQDNISHLATCLNNFSRVPSIVRARNLSKDKYVPALVPGNFDILSSKSWILCKQGALCKPSIRCMLGSSNREIPRVSVEDPGVDLEIGTH
jgi:hypothetical protein